MHKIYSNLKGIIFYKFITFAKGFNEYRFIHLYNRGCEISYSYSYLNGNGFGAGKGPGSGYGTEQGSSGYVGDGFGVGYGITDGDGDLINNALLFDED